MSHFEPLDAAEINATLGATDSFIFKPGDWKQGELQLKSVRKCKTEHDDWSEFECHILSPPVAPGDEPAEFTERIIRFGDRVVSGVCIVALDCGNKIGLVRQFRNALRESSLEVPRGFIQPNENPYNASLREAREEMGMRISDTTEVSDLGVITPLGNLLMCKVAVFGFTNCIFDGSERDFRESRIDLEFYSLSDAIELVVSGEIHDAISGTAILRAWHRF